MCGETEVIVGAGHNDFPPFNLNDRPLAFFNRPEVRIQAGSFGLIRARELTTLFEEIQSRLPW
jgi:hypothetical protein